MGAGDPPQLLGWFAQDLLRYSSLGLVPCLPARLRRVATHGAPARRSPAACHALCSRPVGPQFVKLSLASLAIDTVGFITSFVAVVVLHYSGWIAVALVLFYGVEFTYKVYGAGRIGRRRQRGHVAD